MKLTWLSILFVSATTSACGLGLEGSFIDGRELDLCSDTIPACSGTAGCTLGETNYIETRFPGAVQFIVFAPAEAVVSVSLLFRESRATGTDHEIVFNEPGCFDSQVWRPATSDIFRLAGDDRILEISEQVFLEGEHLISIFSDSTAEVLIKAEVDGFGDSR